MNNIYYNELSKFKQLSDEQITNIYTRYNNGEPNAINEMIEANLKFVVVIAKQYYQTINSANIITLDDLICEGNIGLIQACQKFKLEFGVKFSSYAVYWIRKTIQESIIKNKDNIRSPSNLIESDRKILKAVKELFQKNESEVTKENIQDLGLFNDNEIKHYFTSKQVISIDTQFNVEDTIQENIFDEAAELKRKIAFALKYLTPKEKQLIKMIYGIDQEPSTPSEIWEVLGVTRQRITQLKKSALNKLKDILKDIEL